MIMSFSCNILFIYLFSHLTNTFQALPMCPGTEDKFKQIINCPQTTFLLSNRINEYKQIIIKQCDTSTVDVYLFIRVTDISWASTKRHQSMYWTYIDISCAFHKISKKKKKKELKLRLEALGWNEKDIAIIF